VDLPEDCGGEVKPSGHLVKMAGPGIVCPCFCFVHQYLNLDLVVAIGSKVHSQGASRIVSL